MNKILEIIKLVPKFIKKVEVIKNELVITTGRDELIPLLTFLRDHSLGLYKLLVDIAGVDYPNRPLRFEVVYNLLSVHYGTRIRIKVDTDEITPVPSVTSVYSSANWFEREAWDMYGIFFLNHPDLRRILNDYGFQGYPFRKDFPLSGYNEMRYDDELKRIVSDPVEFAQEIRIYNYDRPWTQE